MSDNLGNVVGLIKGPTAPIKKYVLWAKETDSLNPDVVSLLKYNFLTNSWQPIEGLALVSGQTTGSGSAYVLANNPAINSYAAYQQFTITFHAANTTTTPTINIDGKGAETLVNAVGTALEVGEIKAGQRCIISRVNGNFRIIGGASSSGGGTTPTVEMLTPITNVTVDAFITVQFSSDTAIKVDSLNVALSNANASNVFTLLDENGQSVGIQNFIYDSVTKILRANPTNFLDFNKTYTPVVSNFKNSSASGASTNFSFVTRLQVVNYDTNNIVTVTNSSRINNPYDIFPSEKLGVIFVANAATSSFISILDSNLNLLTTITPDGNDASCIFYSIFFDEINNKLFAFNKASNNNFYINIYTVTKLGNVITVNKLARNQITEATATDGIYGIFNQILFLEYNSNKYIYLSGFFDINKYVLNNDNSISYDSHIVSTFTTPPLFLDTKRNQIIVKENSRRIDVSNDSYIVAYNSNINISQSDQWRNYYYERLQILFVGSQIGTQKAISVSGVAQTPININSQTVMPNTATQVCVLNDVLYWINTYTGTTINKAPLLF